VALTAFDAFRFPYLRRSGDFDLHALAELGRDDERVWVLAAMHRSLDRALDRAAMLELGVSRLRRESSAESSLLPRCA